MQWGGTEFIGDRELVDKKDESEGPTRSGRSFASAPMSKGTSEDCRIFYILLVSELYCGGITGEVINTVVQKQSN